MIDLGNYDKMVDFFVWFPGGPEGDLIKDYCVWGHLLYSASIEEEDAISQGRMAWPSNVY